MKRFAPPRIALAIGLVLTAGLAHAGLPRLPFSGAHGGTLGAGSAAGWDRHGGENPAVLGPPGHGVSLAGYSPFGLEDLRVVELSAARDAKRRGVSIRHRGLFDAAGPGAAESRMQFAFKTSSRASLGVAVLHAAGPAGTGFGFAAGTLWRPYAALGLGLLHEERFTPPGRELRTGFGMDAGGRFGGGYAWRLTVETHWNSRRAREDRFGAGLRFHPLLSAYAGWSPLHRSVGLGVRFGMGDWEGFSALRRHAVLGGTSIQGIRWRKDLQ